MSSDYLKRERQPAHLWELWWQNSTIGGDAYLKKKSIDDSVQDKRYDTVNRDGRMGNTVALKVDLVRGIGVSGTAVVKMASLHPIAFRIYAKEADGK